MDVEITVEYVNERKDTRPASLRGNDGTYYTLSDDAYVAMLPWKGHAGLLGFYTNQKGFNIATHWNGAELPKGQPGQAVRAAAVTPAPITPPPTVITPPPQHTVAPPARNSPLPFGHIHLEHEGAVRTVPTVREQFCMKVVEANIGNAVDNAFTISVVDLSMVLELAKKAWAQTMETPNVEEAGLPPAADNVPGYSDIPPPASADYDPLQ